MTIRMGHHLPIGVIAFLAAVAVFMGIHVSVAGAATTLSTCYGQTPTITGTTDAGEAINGTPGDDVIVAGAGDDTIYGNGGHDFICAGGGNDLVIAGDDPVILAGEDGDDVLQGGPGNDYIDGGRGMDQCDGVGGTNRVYGCTYPTQFVVGQSAPDLIARTAFDNRFRLANLLGQNVMIDFSSMWCPPSVLMAREAASVQANLRAAGVPFTYVLAEVQNLAFAPSVRKDAERMSEGFGLSQLPVLHTEGSILSQLTTQWQEYESENFAYDPSLGSNSFFPNLVFINAAGIVTDINQGGLLGTAIEDHYLAGLPEPTIGSGSISFVGVDIENERAAVDALTITASYKQTLEDQLTNALRALDVWLTPKKSACDWMKQFDSTLKKTPGIGSADRASLLAGAQNIESKLGCTKK